MYTFRTATTTLVDGCVPGMGIMDHGSWTTNPRTVNLFRRALRGTGTITGNHVPWTEYGQLHVTPTTGQQHTGTSDELDDGRQRRTTGSVSFVQPFLVLRYSCDNSLKCISI